MRIFRRFNRAILIVMILSCTVSVLAAGNHVIYLPIVENGPKSTQPSTTPTSPSSTVIPPDDTSDNWPQLGHDAQRTNATGIEVDPPYCYAWKWDAVPIASRAQPVVMNSVLFVGGMDGRLYARDATNGAPLWSFATGGPIRNSPAATATMVITGSYDGYTYALKPANGQVIWKTYTGSSATAPLIDESTQRVFVASTNGTLTAMNLQTGSPIWQFTTGAAILTSPSLSGDGKTVFLGNEAVQAIAVNSASGAKTWQTTLQGESLADRYPVVAGSAVIYRSQPYIFFHVLLQSDGDSVMDQAGSLLSDWSADWAQVKPKITGFLNTTPSAQSFFALRTSDGSSLGTAPVLYTYGDNNPPNVPVYSNGQMYLTYRARHGIQTDNGSIHVSSKYDAELGKIDLSTLDIAGLKNTTAYKIPVTGGPPFRMTSDEPAMLTMGGNILWVDSWERLGGINVSTGALVHAGNVSNTWPECDANCGPAGPNPFFPLSGNKTDAAYPFPSPRVTEGNSRSGVVIANHMVYWRVIEAGLAGIAHSTSSQCAAPKVWRDGGESLATAQPAQNISAPSVSLDTYVTNDLTNPVAITPANQDLVNRLRSEVAAMLATANGQHLMPYFFERGFSTPQVWPYNSNQANSIPEISIDAHGNTVWQDPGELLYSMAMAYPYLDPNLQSAVKSYMTQEMGRYPPLQDLPYKNASKNWLGSGSSREPYAVDSLTRAQLNNWPTVAANLSSIYALWLYSKNTGDWSYAQANWSDIQSLFNSRSSAIKFYADIAGDIGYYRLAAHFGKTSEQTTALNAAVSAMQAGLSFPAYVSSAATAYPDPNSATGVATGLTMPVFYGLTPEVGRYLSEQTGGQAQTLISTIESLGNNGKGFLWWYLTRAGEHDEGTETSFIAPYAAWSHFLAHAYIKQDNQTTLRQWLDYPWAPGDLFSIQKIIATLQAN